MPSRRSIRIVSDGSLDPRNTRVYDAETGRDLSNTVAAVTIKVRPTEPPRAHVTFYGTEFDVVAEVEEAEEEGGPYGA